MYKVEKGYYKVVHDTPGNRNRKELKKGNHIQIYGAQPCKEQGLMPAMTIYYKIVIGQNLLDQKVSLYEETFRTHFKEARMSNDFYHKKIPVDVIKFEGVLR